MARMSPDDEGSFHEFVGAVLAHEILKILPDTPGYQEKNDEFKDSSADRIRCVGAECLIGEVLC